MNERKVLICGGIRRGSPVENGPSVIWSVLIAVAGIVIIAAAAAICAPVRASADVDTTLWERVEVCMERAGADANDGLSPRERLVAERCLAREGDRVTPGMRRVLLEQLERRGR